MQRLQTAAVSTLAKHRFAPPVVVQSAKSVVRIVAARPRSSASVDIARVQMHGDGRASVHMASYQYGPSEWAELGRMFTQGSGESEASAIEAAIHNWTSQ
jgi:hypothetical protein